MICKYEKPLLTSVNTTNLQGLSNHVTGNEVKIKDTVTKANIGSGMGLSALATVMN